MRVNGGQQTFAEPATVRQEPSTTTPYIIDCFKNCIKKSEMVTEVRDLYSGNNKARLDSFRRKFSGTDLSPAQRLALLFDPQRLGFKGDDMNNGVARTFYEELLMQGGNIKPQFADYFTFLRCCTDIKEWGELIDALHNRDSETSQKIKLTY